MNRNYKCDWEVGDYVICIIVEYSSLTLNKEYLVVQKEDDMTYINIGTVPGNYNLAFFNWRFKKSLKTTRKLKLNKLKNELES